MKRGILSEVGSKKINTLSRRSALLMLAVIPVAAMSAQKTSAATDTWTGNATPNTNWLTATNWTGNIAPSAGDSLIFTGANTSGNNNFAGGTRIGSITFDSSAGAFTLSGNATVLGDSAFPYPFSSDPNAYVVDLSAYNSLVNASTNLQTISIPITLSTLDSTNATGGFHILNGGTGGIALTGTFTRATTSTATADFQGTITSNSLVNNANTGIIGGWATYTNGSVVDFAAMSGTNVGAYANYTLASTTIVSAANSVVQLNATAASITLSGAGTTDIDSLNFVNSDLHTIALTTGQQLRMGVTGTIMRSDNTTVTTSGLTITGGNITAGGPVSGTPGELILNSNGSVSLDQNVENVNTILISSPIVDNGVGGHVSIIKTGISSVQLNGANTFTGDIYLNEGRLRAGNVSAFGAAANIYISNGSQLYWGTANMTSTANLFLAGFGEEENHSFVGGAMRLASANVTLAGTITLTDDAMITQRGSGTGGSFITGQITGPHALKLGGGGCGTVFLSNTNNNWTGNTLLFSGTLKLNANEVIPNGAGKGDVYMTGDMGGANVTVFDLNAKNEIINGLNTSAVLTSNPTVTSSGSGSATLTIGDNNASGNFSGNITDSGTGKTLSIVKIGTGTQILNGNGNNTGTVSVNGGVLAITNGSALGGSTINIGASGKLDLSSLGGGFNLANSIPQILNNSGNVTGDFNVNTGGVVSGTSAYGNVTLNGGSVAPGASATVGVVGTTTFGNLTVNSGFLALDLNGAGDKVSVTGTLNLNGTWTIAPNINPVSGTYTIITAGSITNESNIQTNNSGRTTYTLDESVTNVVKLIVSGNPANLRWDNSSGGGDGSSWDLSNLNWFSAAPSNPFQYFDGDSVSFTDTNNGHYTVNINTTVSPGNITVNNSLGDYVLSGSSINGIASLTKSGTRALTLSSSNNYSGGTILNNGTLNIGNQSALGSGTFTINGGTIDNTSGGAMNVQTQAGGNIPITISNSFVFTGAADTSHDINLGRGAVSLTGSSTITISGSGSTLTVGGSITGGTNGIIKAGPGTLVLSGSNSFSGGLTINAGTVRAAAAGAGNGTVTVNATGNFITTGSPAENIVMAGGTLYPSAGNTTFAGNLTLSPSTVSTFVAGDPAATATSLNGNLTGVLHGSGTLIVQQNSGVTAPADSVQGFRIVSGVGTSDFTGTINIAAGAKFELQSATTGSFPVAGTGTIIVNPGTVALGNTLNGTYLEFNVRNNSTGNTTLGNNVQFAAGPGTVLFNALGSAPTGAVIALGNLLIGDQQQLGIYLGSGNTHVLSFSSVSLTGGTSTFSPFLPGFGATTAVGSDLLLSNIGETVAGSNISMAGSRTLMIGGTSTFTGNVSINSGTVQIASSTAFGAATHTPFFFGNATNGTVGTLDLNGLNAVVGGLTDLNGGTSNIITNNNASATGTLVFSTGTSTFGGTIQNGNGTTALSVTSGSLTLTNPQTYTGTTSVSAGGTLTIPSTGSLAGGTTVNANGTVNFANTTQSIAGITGTTGVVNLNATQLTVTTGGSYAGAISDGGTGGSFIVAVGAVQTTGPVNVNVLEVDGKQAFTNTTIRTLSKVNTLTVAGNPGNWSGALDLTSSRLVVEDSSGTRAADIAMYKNMTANTVGGTVGVFSSTAAGNGQVVVVSDNAIRLSVFGPSASNFGTGVGNVDANSILITEAVPGDANLDGVVDLKDLQVLATHWQQPTTDWSQTDFDGNGIVALPDLQALAIHWQNGVGAPGQGSGESFSEALAQLPLGGTSSVPEPMSLAVLGLGGVVLASRRRRA